MNATTGPFTSAGPARSYIRDVLKPYGIGSTRIGALTGIPHWEIRRVLRGRPGRGEPPPAAIPVAWERAILAVAPAPDSVAPGADVPSLGVRRRVQALVALGWSMAGLAGRIGVAKAHLNLLVAGRPTVTRALSERILAVYEELWNQAPPETTRGERIAAARSRGLATRRGWAPPWAWDEDEWDDPEAAPRNGWERRSFWRASDLVAEAAELEGRHYSRTEIAERLGVQRKTLDKAYARVAERECAA